MDIPIQNIYFLLCYAWDKLEERDVVDVATVGNTSLLDLFGRVLTNGTRHLVRRGFDRGYVPQHERTSRLRGRIAIQEAISTGCLSTGSIPCEFDDLSYDVVHNRILKATMREMAMTADLSTETSESLTHLCRSLSEVRDVELTAQLFRQVQLHRNNRFYDFLLKVCELIHRNLLVSEEGGKGKFADFVRDETQMRSLFEAFVRNFFDIESKYKVFRQNIPWRWTAADQASQDLLPRMQTDVVLESEARRVIIECKFTPKALQHNRDSEKLRSEHLYQLSAYLSNLPDESASQTCEGILLYPTVGAPLVASYESDRHKIGIRTINLNQSWQMIHADLLSLVA